MRHLKSLLLCSALALTTGVASTGCAPPPPPGAVYVARRPPRDRDEVIGVRPGPGHIWMRGYWRWEHDDYAWTPGRWAVAERGFHDWAPGRWRHERRGWYYVEGRWR